MKLKQKEAYVYDVLKGLSVSKTFLGVIACEFTLIIANIIRVFISDNLPIYFHNYILQNLFTAIILILSVAYSTLNIICFFNIHSYFSGKADKLFGFKKLYYVQFYGTVIIGGCSLFFPLFKDGFNLFVMGYGLLFLGILITIEYLIYSKLIKNALDIADYASKKFISGKIGNGITVYLIIITALQFFSVIAQFNKPFQYSGVSELFKYLLNGLPSVIGLISLILCYNLASKFKKTVNIK